MKERLQQFLAAENLTQAQFAESIDAAPAGISHILAGRNKPGYDFLLNTMKRYPSLNIEWLMTGKGKMYKTGLQQETYNQPSAPLQRQDELFRNEDETDETIALLPDDNDFLAGFSEHSPAMNENISPTTEIKTVNNTTQLAVKQRKAVKIIVFFDDNTFQEF